jgi:hypothetical protein
VVKAWQAGDFPKPGDDGEITYEMDYLAIGEQLKGYIDTFVMQDLSFDQWNSISLMQMLQAHARQQYKRVHVWQRDATAPLNWATAETFKLALSLDRIHAPYLEIAEMELKFLRKPSGLNKVDHPDSGPCTTKDVYDAMSIVVHKLLGNEIANAYGEHFSALMAVGTLAGPNNFNPQAARITDNTASSQFSELTRQQLSQRKGGNAARGRPRR